MGWNGWSWSTYVRWKMETVLVIRTWAADYCLCVPCFNAERCMQLFCEDYTVDLLMEDDRESIKILLSSRQAQARPKVYKMTLSIPKFATNEATLGVVRLG